MTAYRVTLNNGKTSEHETPLDAETVMDMARQSPDIKRIDIWDADNFNAWPTADEQPTHS